MMSERAVTITKPMDAPVLLFCGDTFLLSRDGDNPFTRILKTFQGLTVCLNLETSLRGEEQKKKNVCLSVTENHLDTIPETVRIISLVNNHVEDSGNPTRLIEGLKRRDKVVIGPTNPSMTSMTLGGMPVHFLSAYFSLPRFRVSYCGARADALEQMLSDSRAERKIVNLHWGYEHTDISAPFQRELAYRLVEAGADIIIGHHPHVPQGWEYYREKPIYYSLGNFNFWQFDGETREDNRWGYTVRYNLVTGRAIPVPYRINENYQPFPVSQEEEDELTFRLRRLSEPISKIDNRTWFMTEYADWYAREMEVWKRRCLERRSLALWLKWAAWLCMPMQWRYRLCTTPFRRRES